MSFSFEQIVRSCEQLTLPADTAGYLMLAAAEQCQSGMPADGGSIVLEDSGAVTVHPRGREPCTPALLTRLLQRLLAAASGENPRLLECAALAGQDPQQFVLSLRAALVPLNRPAARRALVRLHRQLGHVVEAPEEALAPAAEPTPVPRAVLAVEPVAHPPWCEPQPEPPREPELELAPEPEPEPTLVIELETPPLGTLLVAPHERGRQPLPVPGPDPLAELTVPLWHAGGSAGERREMTRPVVCVEPRAAECEADDDPTIPEPVEPRFVAEPVAVAARRSIAARRSDVRELVAGFGVERTVSEAQLLSALQRSVDSHGTPLPPVAAGVRRGSRR